MAISLHIVSTETIFLCIQVLKQGPKYIITAKLFENESFLSKTFLFSAIVLDYFLKDFYMHRDVIYDEKRSFSKTLGVRSKVIGIEKFVPMGILKNICNIYDALLGSLRIIKLHRPHHPVYSQVPNNHICRYHLSLQGIKNKWRGTFPPNILQIKINYQLSM